LGEIISDSGPGGPSRQSPLYRLRQPRSSHTCGWFGAAAKPTFQDTGASFNSYATCVSRTPLHRRSWSYGRCSTPPLQVRPG